MSNETVKAGVQQVVQQLVDERGHVTPSALVAAAEQPDSPAHDGFEWDNDKAAHQHRLNQARTWIRAVTVEVPEKGTTELVHVPVRILKEQHGAEDASEHDSSEGIYRPLSLLVDIPDEYQLALTEFQRQLNAMKNSMERLLKAAEAQGKKTDAAIVAQMVRATELWAQAIHSMQ